MLSLDSKKICIAWAAKGAAQFLLRQIRGIFHAGLASRSPQNELCDARAYITDNMAHAKRAWQSCTQHPDRPDIFALNKTIGLTIWSGDSSGSSSKIQ